MVDSDRKEFGTIMASVYDFWNRELSEVALEIWWESLRNFSFAAVRGALARHMRNPDTGQFIPKPADVVKELGGTTSDASMLAWAKVIGALKQHGTYESVAFDDPVIHRVLSDLGGWVWLGDQKTDEMPFIEKRFRDAYRAWMRSAAAPAHAPHLAGRIESVNSALGHHQAVRLPMLVGDPERAARTAGMDTKQLTEAKT